MTDPPLADLPAVQGLGDPPDLRAADEPLQLLRSHRGQVRQDVPREEVVKERELQKDYERIWLPPPVKHSPWD